MLTRLLLALLCFSIFSSTAFGNEEPLHPDEAFKASIKEVRPGLVEASWDIADEYYLYKTKLKFSTDDEGLTLGEPQIPAGKVKDDQFLGKVETFRKKVSVQIPVSGTGKTLNLKTVSQGCADLGICYPPQKKTLTIDLSPIGSAAADTAAPAKKAGGLGLLSELNNSLGGGDDDELLPPDQAFAFEARLEAPNVIVGEWIIAEKYYMYKDKLKASLTGDGIEAGSAELPPTIRKKDPTFGDVDIWRGPVTIKFPVKGDVSKLANATFDITFQGCADLGVCYPPIKKSIKFDASEVAKLSSAPVAATPAAPPAPAEPQPVEAQAAPESDGMVSEQDAIAAKLSGGNTVLTLLTFFGLGLLLAFTPCVFPMIPILSGIIVGQGSEISTKKALALSVAYVLAMALTYTIVGVLAGLFGANIQAWFQNPWVLSTFAIIFVLLSLSMFGFYELQMPASIQSKLTNISNKQEGGKLASAAIMGVLSALIVGPCVTAPLIGALIYIGQTGDAILGGMALFALSMGMGAPLILIGASAGKLLPRAGMWMEAVKGVFGVMLLGVAIWLLERILPVYATLILSSLLLIASAVYMGALRQIPAEKSGWHTLWKGLGFAMLVFGVLLMIGAASGGKSFIKPLAHLSAPASHSGNGQTASGHLEFKQIKGLAGLNAELEAAKASGKPVMLDFYADWCVSCKEMEAFTFTDPDVQKTLSQALVLQADVTPNDDLDQALLKEFGLFGPPAILFFDKSGTERKNYRVVGFMKAEDFNAHSIKALQ